MLEFDLSDTPLARQEGPVSVPTEGELLAVLVALLLAEQASYSELTHRALRLTETNLGRVAELIEERVPPLAGEFGTRERLAEFVGIKIYCSADGVSL